VHPKNGFASSTPATDGERVYAFLGNHGLLAVDLEGEIVWHRSLGPFEAYHGVASSPLLYQDRVIVVQDHRGRSGSFIAAFDRSTGRELWRTERAAQVGWSSPVAIATPERDEIVMSGQQAVIAYDPKTGDELWRARGNTFEVIPTPVVGHDLLFCSSGRAGPTLAIRPGGSGDVTETHVVWSSPKGSPFVPAPIVYGAYLYMVNDMASVVTVYEAKTGAVAWQERLGTARREGFSAAPVATGGKVFFTNDEGETFVIRAGPDFEVLHVNRLGERVLASPALVGGVWYVRGAEHLYAIGTKG
jgi:outer membrane protein assembly factor BamB